MIDENLKDSFHHTLNEIADQISKNLKLIDIDQILSLTDFIVDMKNNNNRVLYTE